MNITEARSVPPTHRKSTCSESDVFKDIQQTHRTEFFANIRARMEAASAKLNDTPSNLEEQLISPPLLVNNKKSHFDYDEVRLTVNDENS